MDDTRKNLKISLHAWRLLRQIAAATDEAQQAVLERLLQQEVQRLETLATTLPDWNRR